MLAESKRKLIDIVFLIIEGSSGVTTAAIAWCNELYDEILPGKFINGHTTEILCHNRETGICLQLKNKSYGIN